jgi:A/G-specific adenine glycosylase
MGTDQNALRIPPLTRGDIDRIIRVCRWFEHCARDLPWRRRRTGYTALVSELMLQQTQVDRVVDRYRAFMKRFPTIKDLAGAGEEEVLHAWQGLGYYRRATLLHQAARLILQSHGGRLPRSVTELKALPGIGRYTAGAIASIVYRQPEPIVDGNVRRVLLRWDGCRLGDAGKAERYAWARATQLVQQADSPGVFNEAMMELGAVICTPVNPRCECCPVSATCQARIDGLQHDIPESKREIPKPLVHHASLVIRRRDHLLMQQRPQTGLWAGMWQPFTIEGGTRLRQGTLADRCGFRLTCIDKVAVFEHVLSHRRIRFAVYTARTRRRNGHWIRHDELQSLPMSNAHRRVLREAGVRI